MDKFSYNSYPESTESSPRSRDVDFENTPPWEDHQQQQSYKVKLMCSYGGKIQPRPHDNQLTYVNGDTKILSVDRGIRFPAFESKLSAVVYGGGGGEGGGELSFKYQLPGEDLDALISVTNDEDLEHMMHEYDRLLRMSSKPARLRLFLFQSSSISGGFGSEGSTKSDQNTLNPVPRRPESEKSETAADFLFGTEKVAPVQVPQPVPEPVVLEPPPMLVDQRVLQQDLGVNPLEMQRQIQEFQRIQIRDQEQQHLHQNQLHQEHQLQQNQLQQQQQQQQQQQEAMYRRKSEDEAGRYFSPTYAQNPTPAPTNPQSYWQGNNSNIPGNVYITTSQNLPEQQQQQVYMIPAQSQAQGQPLYQSVMRPSTVQGNQNYYPPVQYMDQQSQQSYNVVQPQPPYSGGPQVITSGGPQMGLQEPYSQMGYYTMAGEGMMVQPPPPQPQFQGMGQPVSGMTDLRAGPDGKMVVNMAAPKVSQNSDSV